MALGRLDDVLRPLLDFVARKIRAKALGLEGAWCVGSARHHSNRMQTVHFLGKTVFLLFSATVFLGNARKSVAWRWGAREERLIAAAGSKSVLQRGTMHSE